MTRHADAQYQKAYDMLINTDWPQGMNIQELLHLADAAPTCPWCDRKQGHDGMCPYPFLKRALNVVLDLLA